MKLWTLINTTKGERAHLVVLDEGEFVTSYGIDMEVPVDADHWNGRATIHRQSFVMPDQDETEEEIKEEIEPIYVDIRLYELDNADNRIPMAMWRMPLDMVLRTALMANEKRPDSMNPTRLEIEVKQFKLNSQENSL